MESRRACLQQRPVSFYDNYRVPNGGPPLTDTCYMNNIAGGAPIVQPEVGDNEYDLEPVEQQHHNGDAMPRGRPYQNTKEDEDDGDDRNRLLVNNNVNGGGTSVAQQPSLTYCLQTTVPQNIAAATIAGRHAPTRNSLRHSRMIVLNRSAKVEKFKRKGSLIRRQGIGRILVGLQTIFGSLLCIVSLWLLLWAPNIPRQDNPYWSSVPLLLSGIVGLLLLGCCQQKKYKNIRHYCVQSFKMISVFLSLVACFVCTVASVFAVLHIVTLSQMICEPEFELNKTCVCHRVTSSSDGGTTTSSFYHYIDLSCPEVDGILYFILIFSATAHALAVLVTLGYLYIHWTSRFLYSYTSVNTSEQRTAS